MLYLGFAVFPSFETPQPWTVGDVNDVLQGEIEEEEQVYEQTGDFASRIQQEADRLKAYESATNPESIDDSSDTLETPVLVSGIDANSKSGSSETDTGVIYTRRIKYVTTIPEYPQTHPEGLLYVISTANLSNEQKQQPWKEVSFTIHL